MIAHIPQHIELYPLGIGSFGSVRLWHNTFVLYVDHVPYVVDCPKRLRPMLEDNLAHGERPISLADYRSVILTHLHIDHAGGLIELVADGGLSAASPMSLFAPQPLLDDLWSDQIERGVVTSPRFPNGATDLDRCFRPTPLNNPHDFGSFQLHFRPTQHIPNTYAYLFDFGDYRLGYSADAAFDPALLDWLDQCDVIIHDALLGQWEMDEEVQKLHAPLFRLLELPIVFQQKTYLCHVDENTYLKRYPGAYQYLEQQRIYRLKG